MLIPKNSKGARERTTLMIILPSGAISKSPNDFGFFGSALAPDVGRLVVTS